MAGLRGDSPARLSLPLRTKARWKPNPRDVRPDGSMKGPGFLGPLKRPDGGVSTELSIGIDGQDVPTMVPTLDSQELNYLLQLRDGQKIWPSIVQKAARHATMRKRRGLSVFAP